MFSFSGSLEDLNKEIIDEKLNKEFDGLPGRQRPRDSQKESVLRKWEKERDGLKIGTIS